MEIVIDTNMLVEKNIIKEIANLGRPVILSSVIDELEKLDNPASKIAIEIVKKKNMPIIRVEESGDTAILNYAKNNQCAVATNDKELMSKLKENGIRIFRLRQNRYLVEE